MKAILVCGVAANQRALAHRLHALHPLAYIAAIRLPIRRKRWAQSLASATVGRPLADAWRSMIKQYEGRYPDFPITPEVYTSANDPSLTDFLAGERPDVILLSGTDLVRARTIEAAGSPIVNLHTGISPYIKGAPNCTNWALALGEFGLIGNTIMWLDTGIDSGNIITTEQTPLDGLESLPELHLKVMDHAHDLYGRAYQRLRDGAQLPSVRQAEIGEGRLFLSRQWTASRMRAAVRNHRFLFGPEALAKAEKPVLVPLMGPHPNG